ncbi:MAG: alpha/beta hydrolase [Bacteroidales bacterium]|nr:alpha/beta hydrolase [Bacteroidales bacterium]
MKTHNLLIIILLIGLLSACRPNTLEQIKTEFITLGDQTKIAYKTYGEGETTLVFVHGFGCDMNAWEAQYDYFKDKAQLVFLDLPGYGQSDQPKTDYTLDYYADAVKILLESLKVKNAVLVGHSLGTAICRQTIFNSPQMVEKLVDVDGVYCFFGDDSITRAENEKQYAQFVALFQGDDITKSMEGFIQPFFVEQTPENVRNYAMTTMTKTPQWVAYSTMKNLTDQRYWTGKVINIPSLIIASKNSQIPPDYKQMMNELYSDMQYHELDNVGHFIMMEQPEMFNRMLEEFVMGAN